mmetsp:Transcript_55196/g.132182  ORF Transcript_55196/g.132182 Transcript_55196/m.132182 type:complete len:201 (+) Transcript_55196:68-670(+)
MSPRMMAAPLLVLLGGASAFAPPSGAHALLRTSTTAKLSTLSMAAEADRVFELKLKLGDAGTANLRFKAREPSSESVVVRYAIPFGLNVENQGGEGLQKGTVVRAVVTKDGTGGEKVGDVLRYCSEYRMQLAGSGSENSILTTVASFGGVLAYKIGLFDVVQAKTWEDVVEALVSNTPERTEEVVLVFERPTKDMPNAMV